ncbi:hypothetical protein Tco_0152864 [Tanacetum coccineum]
MMTYLKHVGNFKHSELKTKKFEEIQALYEKIKRRFKCYVSTGNGQFQDEIPDGLIEYVGDLGGLCSTQMIKMSFGFTAGLEYSDVGSYIVLRADVLLKTYGYHAPCFSSKVLASPKANGIWWRDTSEEIVHDFEQRLETIFGSQVNRVHILYFEGLTPNVRQDLAEGIRMVYLSTMGRRIGDEMGLDAADTLCFQLGGARRRSERVIPDKGDLSDYWVKISSGRDFLRGAPSYTYIRDPVKMNDPNITMEEYIRLEEEKARKRGKVFNWETAKYGKIWYDEDVHDLRSVETEFPAIAFNDQISSKKTLSCEPTDTRNGNDDMVEDLQIWRT